MKNVVEIYKCDDMDTIKMFVDIMYVHGIYMGGDDEGNNKSYDNLIGFYLHVDWSTNLYYCNEECLVDLKLKKSDSNYHFINRYDYDIDNVGSIGEFIEKYNDKLNGIRLGLL